MNISFYKYHGAGNDFIMIDDRTEQFIIDKELIKKICHRRFGVGGDGLILLQNDENQDFKMRYFNSDGQESTMCGNGGRCIVAFARDLGCIEKQCIFSAIDGLHEAHIENDTIDLKMIDVLDVEKHTDHYFLNTGSPHHVEFKPDIDSLDVFDLGRKLRYSQLYVPIGGSNINFVQILDENLLYLRTYERGVEDETLACGTGATAAALAYMEDKNTTNVNVKTLGGNLSIRAQKKGKSYVNIWLKGPAIKVFEGVYFLNS